MTTDLYCEQAPIPTLEWSWVDSAPELAAEELHLWLVALEGLESRPIDTCMRLLSEPERARAARLQIPQRRERWIRSTAGCRAILASYLRIDPAKVQFMLGHAGKPSLRRGGLELELELEFNLTNSGAVALLAVSSTLPVGIDCEQVAARSEVMRIARRMFRAGEAEALARLSGRDRDLAFYRAWTALEARVKADGTGLAGRSGPTLDGLEVAHANATPDTVCAVARQRLPSVDEWQALRLSG